jgi:hypothetical protein
MARLFAMAFALALLAGSVSAGEKLGYQDTPMLPDGKWHVHDGERPQPKVITPPTASTNETPGKPPSDAVVLFDGTNLDKWKNKEWKIEDGAMIEGKGNQVSIEEFGDMHLHIEWSAPVPAKGTGQGRGNSGVFLMGLYEIQVLDCYENKTYPDGQAASIYGQYPPLVNATRPPGEWNIYDILFTAPVFKDGKLETPGYVTMFHNGVCVHNHTAIIGAGTHKKLAVYSPHGPKGPVQLQDHGNPTRFRNIWVRPINKYDE